MVYRYPVVIVGYGAAALREAEALCDKGISCALVTENTQWGTSRNAGSDKQTYYKLSLGGSIPDSVSAMAKNFYSGLAVDGEHALQEASLSAESFLHLVELGVPFPRNAWGEYVGYRTDHDETTRATSAGPYTSRMMVEALEKRVKEKGIPVYEKEQLTEIMTDHGSNKGIVCWNTKTNQFDVFESTITILATGGPADLYHHSVYPASQHGATGIAFLSGASGRNLTEWQQGLASIKPRWNVSGSYMQVIPRFVSTDKEGKDEREFLNVLTNQSCSLVFLKGYQWPFDSSKAMHGSSLIDLLVQNELLKGRRVFLDYRKNPEGFSLDALSKEARDYLMATHATGETPYARLLSMNSPAIAFYQEHGVDLSREMLEISLCVQHANGGILVDGNWETTVRNLFAIGEAACTHGVRRPGGSALNAGQVGALRSSRVIERRRPEAPTENNPQFQSATILSQAIANKKASNVQQYLNTITEKMSDSAGAIREKGQLQSLLKSIDTLLEHWSDEVSIESEAEASLLFRLWDVAHAAQYFLTAMVDYLDSGRGSRGGALYSDPEGEKPLAILPESFRFRLWDESDGDMTQCIATKDGQPNVTWRKTHPIPQDTASFEETWKAFRKENEKS